MSPFLDLGRRCGGPPPTERARSLPSSGHTPAAGSRPAVHPEVQGMSLRGSHSCSRWAPSDWPDSSRSVWAEWFSSRAMPFQPRESGSGNPGWGGYGSRVPLSSIRSTTPGRPGTRVKESLYVFVIGGGTGGLGSRSVRLSGFSAGTARALDLTWKGATPPWKPSSSSLYCSSYSGAAATTGGVAGAGSHRTPRTAGASTLRVTIRLDPPG